MNNGRQKRLSSEFMADRYRLMAFIRGMVRDNQVAEDIFQEVWLRLDEAIKRDVEIKNSYGWCRAVARNLILRYWRDQRNAKVIVDDELLSLVETAFQEQDAEQTFWRARENALKNCLEQLPERSRDVLSLRYNTGLPIAQVAHRLESTITGITKMLSRLRQKLRDCVAKALQLQGITS